MIWSVKLDTHSPVRFELLFLCVNAARSTLTSFEEKRWGGGRGYLASVSRIKLPHRSKELAGLHGGLTNLSHEHV
jgi:hypothetical protein